MIIFTTWSSHTVHMFALVSVLNIKYFYKVLQKAEILAARKDLNGLLMKMDVGLEHRKKQNNNNNNNNKELMARLKK